MKNVFKARSKVKAGIVVVFLTASAWIYLSHGCSGIYSLVRSCATDNKEVTPVVVTSNEFLQVDSPKPYQEITSPVLVSGKSNFFETTTSVTIRVTDGPILVNKSVNASGWMDKLYPFSVAVNYTKQDIPKIIDHIGPLTGVVEVYEVSPKDGSPINKISIPVVFKDL
jgi:hypothetical protein